MFTKWKLKQAWMLVVLIAAVLLMVWPVAAQTNTTQPDTVVVEGTYSVAADGTITVADYVIAPANAFIPPDIADGDSVIVTGYLLPDGVTAQALSIEIEAAATPQATPEANPSGTDDTTTSGNGHGNGRSNAGGNGHRNGNGSNGNSHANGNGASNSQQHMNANANAGANGQGANNRNSAGQNIFCAADSSRIHPAAAQFAKEFNVSYAQVMALFCDGGHGFGEILIAYRLAAATGQSAQSILSLRDAGEGWGQIFQDLGADPSQVMGNHALGRFPLGEAGPPGLTNGANGNGHSQTHGNNGSGD